MTDDPTRELEARVFFKCENLQKVGAFKARGATNAVLSLDDEQAARGVRDPDLKAALLRLAGRRRHNKP